MKRSGLGALAAAALLAGCGPPRPLGLEFTAGNATGRVTLDRVHAGQLSAAAADARRQCGAAWAIFDESNPRSEISRINGMAGAYRLKISHNAFRALDLAHYYSQLSGGAFDITTGPLRQAWGLDGSGVEATPEDEELTFLRELTGPQLLQLSEQRDVSILSPGARIAVGDLVFAYGVDLAAVDLRQRNLAPALVEWEDYARALPGGDGGPPRVRRIQDPTAEGAFLGELDLAPDAAFASVRLWERAAQIGTQKIPGVINPLTGRPAGGTLLVAVRGPTCIQAHALAMALLAQGLDAGARLLEAFGEFDALVVPDRRPIEIWATPGMARHFTPRADLADRLQMLERPPAPDGGAAPAHEAPQEP